MNRIGIDVGGTFTDVVLIEDDGRAHSVKVPTTPRDRVIGAVAGFRRVLEVSGIAAETVGFVGHGTTMATNMVVEGTGAKTALVTTRGFRDILELRRIARHDRADLYDLLFDNPKPLVARRHRYEVPERLDHRGGVELPLDMQALAEVAEAIAASDVEAVAVCFLHAFINPAHEQTAAHFLAERLPGRFITASHAVNPELGEYERTSTTIMNAMLGPICARYIRNLGGELQRAGFHGELMFMQSNGGLAHAEMVAARPVMLLESGPAGGVSAALRLSDPEAAGVILGDMGGTTFDVSLIREGRPELRHSSLLHSYAVRAPSIDIDSIGAGGGSIAWIDAGGGVRIGPQSAGADPGPACYGRGGTRPTVTDCNLVLGYIDPDTFLDGGFRLDVAAAEAAIRTHLAEPLGMPVLRAARTVRAVANALMAQAMRLMTVERGYDPREFSYLCFGGAGPLHALDLARELEIRRVIVPPLPGLFSALGMVLADRKTDGQAAVERELSSMDVAWLEQRFAALEGEVLASFRAGGIAPEQITLRRGLDCRYAGQPDSIAIDLPPEGFSGIGHAFAAAHQRLWNFTKPDQSIIVNNLRIEGQSRTGWRGELRVGTPKPRPEPWKTRDVALGEAPQTLPVWRRRDLPAGFRIAGPAVVEEQSSCIILGPGESAEVDAALNLVIGL
ncbi:hydantoinase/oxoprolinase family protein [Roseomonas sp. E05]|uniref:hydantoinase/oxoprolinase family protein n=1 Tax=Roseomonas sp. E05 TaxID=3046310 RepID=UPI0024BB96EE|nr:hydantoinase/oxoprolinase family protein [Roseomonas sp. E05]MDJ0390545.1 hydantoinase/oxoprolinase family protein [Roseomonas sp. E05]